MKNLVVLLMTLALIGGVSAQCGTGPLWGLANSENPYTFSTDADPFTQGACLGTDGWNGWDGVDNDVEASTSGGLLTIDRSVEGGYGIVFIHDNALADIGVTAGVDKIILVIEVVSISAGANAIVKIEQYDAATSFPNPDDGSDTVVTDAWDPDTTITGPGRYTFTTAAVCDLNTVAVTPVIGVGNGGTIVIDEIWIGTDNSPCGAGETTKAFGPNPDNSSIQPSGSVTQLEWVLPLPMDCTSDLTVDLRFEQELGTDDSGNYVYDPNWGAANGTPTTMVTTSGLNKTSQSVSELTPYTSPLADGLYSWRVDVTDPSVGGPGTTEGNVWLFAVSDCYNIDLVGDLDENCKVNLADFAKLAANWLIDCINDPACVTP